MKESLLAVVKTINATHQTTQPVSNTPAAASPSLGSFFASASMPPMELVFRGARVMAVFFGILFLLTMLRGSFKYIVSSGRDDTVTLSRRMIFIGGAGVLVMFFLYTLASAELLKILANG